MDEGRTLSTGTLVKALTLFHSILLQKLMAQGLDKCTLHWIETWLDGRAQRVVVNGATPG